MGTLTKTWSWTAVPYRNYPICCPNRRAFPTRPVRHLWRCSLSCSALLTNRFTTVQTASFSAQRSLQCHVTDQIRPNIDELRLTDPFTSIESNCQRHRRKTELGYSPARGFLTHRHIWLSFSTLVSSRSMPWIIWCGNWNRNSFDNTASWMVLAVKHRTTIVPLHHHHLPRDTPETTFHIEFSPDALPPN